MDAPKIDKGIPFPTDVRGDIKYPFFSEMEVGDSVFFTLEGNDNANRMKNRLSQATRTYGKKQTPERHFIVRYRLEDEVSGVRVWRKD
jgi:hypothetical protein|tara:strand:+ start:1989 stop:2252 length:264 start_codon:yes stop_codon:yes gene_type:complete